MMAYSSGFLNSRIQVMQKIQKKGAMGVNSAQASYEPVCCLWANVAWSKGMKSMREGALDAYDTVMIRTRWAPELTRDKFIEHEGTMYQIMSLKGDRRANEIQIVATEIIKQ